MHHVVFFAVPQEREPFLKLLKSRGLHFERRVEGGLPKLAQVHEAHGITVVVTGMGPRNARQAAEVTLPKTPPSAIWTCGFAGGLDPALKLGDVVFDADGQFAFVDSLARSGAVRAPLVTAETVAVTQAQKSELRQKSGAGAVDMESSEIRLIAARLGFPSATVRGISDTAEQDLPLDFNALVSPDGGIAPLKLAVALLSAPQKIPQLIRFARDTARVGRRLSEVLASAILRE